MVRNNNERWINNVVSDGSSSSSELCESRSLQSSNLRGILNVSMGNNDGALGVLVGEGDSGVKLGSGEALGWEAGVRVNGRLCLNEWDVFS